MINLDIKGFADSHWIGNRKSVTMLSKSGDTGNSLVVCDEEQYCFDDISKTLNDASSVDAIDFKKNGIELIEYKSGFADKISVDKYNPDRVKCPTHTGESCEEYWKIVCDNRKKDKEILKNNIKLKAVESYITLEKCVFPHCENATGPQEIKLTVVIDVDPMEEEVKIFSDLSGTECDRATEMISSIKESLSRFLLKTDVKGNVYYYDSIDVVGAKTYYKRLIG